MTMNSIDAINTSARSLIKKRLYSHFPQDSRPILAGYVVLIALVLFYIVINPSALSLRQLSTQVSFAMPLIFISTGQIMVMLTGELDLSVGGVVSLVTCLSATLMTGSLGYGAIALIIAVAAVAGIVNGVLVAYLALPAFVVTLATWSILNGLALIVLNVPGGTLPQTYTSALSSSFGGLSISVYVLIALILLWLWFRKTRLISKFRALGSNRTGAHEAGVDTKKMMVLAFVMCSVLSAIGALYLTARLGGGDPTVGSSYVLNSVAAAVVGGTALTGGQGDGLSAVLGALIITLLGSVVFSLGLPSYWQTVASGALLLLAAGVTQLARRGAA